MENEIIVNDIVYVKKESVKDLDEEYVIIRSYGAGVFFGVIDIYDDNTKSVIMKRARRIYYWDGAATLSELAIEGPQKPETCKFPCETFNHTITKVEEIIPCSKTAVKTIKEVPIWSMK